MWALVPLKLLANAKQRLTGKLTPAQRQALVLAMAGDVLHALAQCQRIEHILLISTNAEAQPLAEAVGAELFAESAAADLPQALQEAVRYACTQSATGVCIVPADAPLITAADLDLVLAGHTGCTVVPDAQFIGTNALVLSPPDLMPPIFDGQSFKPHLRAAVAAGLPARVVCSERLGLDIDTPADLQTLDSAASTTATGRYLRSLKIDHSV